VPFSGLNFGQITQKAGGVSTNKYDRDTAIEHLKEIKRLMKYSEIEVSGLLKRKIDGD
jgi:hypothetical protein